MFVACHAPTRTSTAKKFIEARVHVHPPNDYAASPRPACTACTGPVNIFSYANCRLSIKIGKFLEFSNITSEILVLA
jgi:hypothetical protein